ncbi:MAG: STAS domain-containing protein [Nitrosomonadales bacterium]|nr:STAS domain-containing protein [Nitrosomonadales bacterium]
MSISTLVKDSTARLAMSGRFDFHVHREFKDAYTPVLENAAVREIEVEMSNVDYLDSSALGMLMLLNERAKATNKSVTLLNSSDVVSQVLEVANFGKIFNIRRAN